MAVFNAAFVLDVSPPDAEYRRCVVLRCLLLLQDRVDHAGGHYSGSMQPNFTSVAQLLTCSYAELLDTVDQFPVLDPAEEFVPLASMSTYCQLSKHQLCRLESCACSCHAGGRVVV